MVDCCSESCWAKPGSEKQDAELDLTRAVPNSAYGPVVCTFKCPGANKKEHKNAYMISYDHICKAAPRPQQEQVVSSELDSLTFL